MAYGPATKGVAPDYLLKIDTIDGESQQKGHEKWIEVLSWSWGASNGGSSKIGSGAGAGKVVMRDFEFVVEYGTSSPKLFGACCTGQHIKSAVLHIRKAGGNQETFVEWRFTDLLISSYKTAGVGGGGDVDKKSLPLPRDEVSFNFDKLEMAYKPQNKDGTLGASRAVGFNVKTGAKV